MAAHPISVDELLQREDHELVALAQQALPGGPAERETASRCLGLVVARHRDLVRAVILAKVPVSAVDDVESQVLARFAAKVYSGGVITNPAGLLIRMAQFERADYHEGLRRSESPIEEWDDAASDPELERAANAEAVAELLAPLSEKQRDIVLRRIIEGRPSAEVADAHNTTAGNIDVIVYRALQKMKEALG